MLQNRLDLFVGVRRKCQTVHALNLDKFGRHKDLQQGSKNLNTVACTCCALWKVTTNLMDHFGLVLPFIHIKRRQTTTKRGKTETKIEQRTMRLLTLWLRMRSGRSKVLAMAKTTTREPSIWVQLNMSYKTSWRFVNNRSSCKNSTFLLKKKLTCPCPLPFTGSYFVCCQ